MYLWVLILHGLWRWVVIAAGAAVVLRGVRSWARHSNWSAVDARLSRLLGVAIDIQVLMGAALYLTLSPLTNAVASRSGTNVAGSDLHFFVLSHALTMIVALFAVHISSVLVRRASSDLVRQRRAVVCYGLTLVIVLAGTPWWRPWLRW
jgi:hypothetical protein